MTNDSLSQLALITPTYLIDKRFRFSSVPFGSEPNVPATVKAPYQLARLLKV
ncbi:hypothetical protein LC605_32800 [Nostoc sp. CHAB 5836]|uniref:hypothetical protein n=1 Tax=Nostoc sp. CHAB 5836 TaxID=2780404 RepID=UPI001E5ABAC6|nr:hypothetical protein [Nostoc sp. CHAB 5836]MCC5619717.1 hypothetical protein [Nostoc sp. CHAB 5836]